LSVPVAAIVVSDTSTVTSRSPVATDPPARAVSAEILVSATYHFRFRLDLGLGNFRLDLGRHFGFGFWFGHFGFGGSHGGSFQDVETAGMNWMTPERTANSAPDEALSVSSAWVPVTVVSPIVFADQTSERCDVP
jgi:hypothetical protein